MKYKEDEVVGIPKYKAVNQGWTDRQLKFRAFSQRNGIFVATGFHMVGETTLFDLLNQYRLEELDDLVIQQAVGLADREGVDMYEGDIYIEQYDRNDDPQSMPDVVWGSIKYRVWWDPSYHAFMGVPLVDRFGTYTSRNLPLGIRNSEIRIIGNILQNPEML